MPRKAGKKFIARAIKRPGALTSDVGGPPARNLAKVRWLAQHGTPKQRARARFYLQVLRPAIEKRKKGR